MDNELSILLEENKQKDVEISEFENKQLEKEKENRENLKDQRREFEKAQIHLEKNMLDFKKIEKSLLLEQSENMDKISQYESVIKCKDTEIRSLTQLRVDIKKR